MQVVKFIVDHKAEILGGLFCLSEALSFIPQVKANGVFQFIFGLLKKAEPQHPQV